MKASASWFRRLLRVIVVMGGVLLAGLSGSTGATGAQIRPVTAYVANALSGTVTPIDLGTNTAGVPIPVGKEPQEIAITPDGETAYVADFGSGTVTPIDLATNSPGTPITVGGDPYGIAITPDGKTAYITNPLITGATDFDSGYVTPIDLATNSPGTPITVGGDPDSIAITPDGKTAYVPNPQGWLTPIDVATNTVGTRIPLAHQGADGIAITPDGTTAYIVYDSSPGYVTPLDLATNTVGTPIAVGCNPVAIAITPSRPTAYVFVQCGGGYVMPIDMATNTVGSPITVGGGASGIDGIAITPNGETAYVANGIAVEPIDLATNTVGTPITVGDGPYNIAITPDTTQPTTTITLAPEVPNGLNGWYKSSVGVTVSAADNPGGSGVAETRCVLDPENAPSSFAALTSGPCSLTSLTSVGSDGTHTVYAATKDKNGNLESPVVSSSFKIDKTAPVIHVPSTITVNATVPAGATVSYAATATDTPNPNPPVSCAPLPNSVYAIGMTTVNCSVTDLAGNTASASFTVYVKGAAQQLADLADAVAEVGPGRSLAATVKAAQWFVGHRQSRAACLTLTAFNLEVRAQSGKKIPAATAAELIVDANQIKSVLGCTR